MRAGSVAETMRLQALALDETTLIADREKSPVNRHIAASGSKFLRTLPLIIVLAFANAPLHARAKDTIPYGQGLVVNLPFPEGEVVQVLEDVTQDGIIRGSKEYSKDEYVAGATAATSTRAFPEWTEGGKVFYKLRTKALAPQNFKQSNDVGTLAVRYVVQSQDASHTVLHIDAVFVEDFRHLTHPSDGSVEGAEYKDIHDRLDALALMKNQGSETDQAPMSSHQDLASATDGTAVSAASMSSDPPSSEQHILELRRQVERLVKSPGAPLKSAPFRTATTLQSLPGGAEVAIVIVTPYWLGVETQDGHRGWMLRDDLELLP